MFRQDEWPTIRKSGQDTAVCISNTLMALRWGNTIQSPVALATNLDAVFFLLMDGIQGLCLPQVLFLTTEPEWASGETGVCTPTAPPPPHTQVMANEAL